jgi:hypothetical protein
MEKSTNIVLALNLAGNVLDLRNLLGRLLQ